jgi:hypothetical protein
LIACLGAAPSVGTSSFFKILRDLLKDRQAIVSGLILQLDYDIIQREREPRRRTGFNEIRERDGPGSVPRDGRNRLGRPPKNRPSWSYTA